MHWVCTEKTVDGRNRIKARLVARGFEEIPSEKLRDDSPTGSKEVLRILMALMASNGWTCNTIDIKAAFLQGNKLDRDVHLKPPVEVESDGKLWKLNKCVYGLSYTSRVWYFSVRDELLKCGCIQSKADLLFYWYYDDKLAGLFLMHVNDFFWGGNSAFRDTVISRIISTFQIGKEESGLFKFIGLQIKQDEEKITVNHQSYINGISLIYISKARLTRKYDPLNKEEIRSLR